ncbi:amino acid ABC transporter, periplasmic amino acid-binding protein [gamma proteobacterium IMCC1989]|nr:amino acid ABC transporter, periplasmic amino acid-binding protein [gamma proteobacterium IMCC1989]
MKLLKTIIVGVLFLAALGVKAGTLEDVRERGFVSCGVSDGLTGFSQKNDKGVWSGLDVDVCRAVAAAVFSDADKVAYKPLTAKERFVALQSNEVDLLSRNTTWTLTRDVAMGLKFAGINYYDGQGFLVSQELGVSSAFELDGASFCVQAGSTSEVGIEIFFNNNNMTYKRRIFDKSSDVRDGLDKGMCDVISSDQSQLYSFRTGLMNPESFVVLPEVISKEPLGPVVRQGDDTWFNIVRWSLVAMIEAEFLGITSLNVDILRKSGELGQKRLLGSEGELSTNSSLSADWAYNIIKQVGNYSESFERNVGSESTLKIARGLNAQWNAGGILYSPPIL